jgi:hypothetical protein
MEARLRDEVIVAGYEALPDVYEWLIPDAKLTPEGSVAALGDLVQSLPSSGAQVPVSLSSRSSITWPVAAHGPGVSWVTRTLSYMRKTSMLSVLQTVRWRVD